MTGGSAVPIRFTAVENIPYRWGCYQRQKDNLARVTNHRHAKGEPPLDSGGISSG